MHTLTATGALFCSLVLAACGGGYGSDTPADGETGIRGVVQAGPQCAVEVAESPCPDLPWDGMVRVSAGGDEVAEISTDAKGQFRVAVEPGTYDVMPVVGDGIGSSQSQTVTVAEGRFAAVELSVDTGIR